MNNEFKDRILRKAAIGGSLSAADLIILIKDLMSRVDELENKHGETTVSGTTDSKVSKRKAASAGVPAESDDKG